MNPDKQQELVPLQSKLAVARFLGWLCLVLFLLPVLLAGFLVFGSLNAKGHDAGFGLVVLLMAAVPMLGWAGAALVGIFASFSWARRLKVQCAKVRLEKLAVAATPLDAVGSAVEAPAQASPASSQEFHSPSRAHFRARMFAWFLLAVFMVLMTSASWNLFVGLFQSAIRGWTNLGDLIGFFLFRAVGAGLVLAGFFAVSRWARSLEQPCFRRRDNAHTTPRDGSTI